MTLDSPYADHLFVLLLMGGIAGGVMTERTIHLAMIKASSYMPTRQFFARDGVIMALTLTASTVALLPAINYVGVNDTISFLSVLRQELSFYGWAISFLAGLHVVSPFIVASSLLIGRHKRANGRRKRIKNYGIA